MVFFLGNDMRFNRKYLERNGIDFSVKERMITARRGETYDMGELKVQALGSNDAGVSFLVHYGGKDDLSCRRSKRLELVCQKGLRRTMRHTAGE